MNSQQAQAEVGKWKGKLADLKAQLVRVDADLAADAQDVALALVGGADVADYGAKGATLEARKRGLVGAVEIATRELASAREALAAVERNEAAQAAQVASAEAKEAAEGAALTLYDLHKQAKAGAAIAAAVASHASKAGRASQYQTFDCGVMLEHLWRAARLLEGTLGTAEWARLGIPATNDSAYWRF